MRCLHSGSEPGFASIDIDLPWNISKSIPTTHGQSFVKGENRCQNSNKTCIYLETYKIPCFREDFDVSRNYSLQQNEHYTVLFSARKPALESRSPIKKKKANNKQHKTQ